MPAREVVASQLRAFTGLIGSQATAALATKLHHVSLSPDSLLFRQGEIGDAMYFVVLARLTVIVTRDDGHEVRIGEVCPGELVGETALVSGEPRMASVRAQGDCTLLRLSRGGYDLLIAGEPQAIADFARVMAERVARSARTQQAVSALRTTTAVTVEECAAVLSIPDPFMLDLAITRLSHRIALDLAMVLGAQDLNWFVFGCRASNAGGSAIPGQDVPILGPVARALVRLLPAVIADPVRRWRLVRRTDAALDAAATYLGDCDRLIFSETAPVFVRLVALCIGQQAYDDGSIDALVSSLAPGAAETGGQELLRDAVRAYYEAAFEPDPKRRAELILLGSIRIGLHRQMRLDPLIDQALDRPMTELIGGAAPWLSRLPRTWRAAERARNLAWRPVRRLVAARVARIRLGASEMQDGADLPRAPGWQRRPDLLTTLHHSDLAALFVRFDRDLSSRAIDWNDLDDRMRYVVNLLRSRQRSLELFEPPFPEEAPAIV